MNDIRLGVSLFSLGYEYASGKLDLAGCIDTAHRLGYTGFELVSAQMVPPDAVLKILRISKSVKVLV